MTDGQPGLYISSTASISIEELFCYATQNPVGVNFLVFLLLSRGITFYKFSHFWQDTLPDIPGRGGTRGIFPGGGGGYQGNLSPGGGGGGPQK
jgi:hypothetical protein